MDDLNKRVKELYDYLYKNSSDFREFVKKTEDMTVEDIAMEYDIDLSILSEK